MGLIVFCVLFIPLPLPQGHNYCSYIVILHIGEKVSFILFQNYLDSFWAFLLRSQRNLNVSVHNVITRSHHKLETTKMSFNDEWFKELWCIYVREHYSAVEGSE